MSLEEVLNTIGLTKYESQAFYYILLNGSAEAAEITKDTNIPNGKIYETLNKLELYGFIEIQDSRPKKYRAKNINMAIEEYLDQKRSSMDNEFKKLQDLGSKVIQEFEQIHIEKKPVQDEIFWRTAFGEEMNEVYYSSMKEAKHSIFYFLPHSIHDRSLAEVSLKKHKHESHQIRRQERELITKLLTENSKQKTIQILFAGQNECPFFKDLFELLIDSNLGNEIKAIQKDIITPPILLIDDSITIMDIVDPLDNHTTMGITKIWDRRLNATLKEKIQALWEKSSDYREIFPLTKN